MRASCSILGSGGRRGRFIGRQRPSFPDEEVTTGPDRRLVSARLKAAIQALDMYSDALLIGETLVVKRFVWQLPIMLALALSSGANAEGSAAPANSPLVVVAGASGKTGRLVLERAAKAGYRVRGMARDPAKARTEIPGDYEWISGDVRDPATLKVVLAGATYVVCAIGATERSGPNSPQFVDYGGVKNLSDAAKAAGVKQFVLISSTGAGGGGGATSWLLNTLLMPGILEWKGKGEQYLRASGLPYTIVRPGGLNNDPGGQQGIRFTQGDNLGGGTIPRGDVATVIVAALGNADAINKTFEMASDEKAALNGWRQALASLKKD